MFCAELSTSENEFKLKLPSEVACKTEVFNAICLLQRECLKQKGKEIDKVRDDVGVVAVVKEDTDHEVTYLLEKKSTLY